MTDAELLEAIQEGRPDAFDAFVERYGRRLLAFGLRMCGHHQDAEDVFQDTLLKAYQALEQVRDPGAVRTWLFRVASSQCLMKRRKQKPGREVSLSDVHLNLDPDDEVDFAKPLTVADWSARPHRDAERSELHDTLEKALATLPPEIRMVVLLRDVEGLSTREVADALEIGLSAAKMRLHRGRLALREHLQDYYQEVA